MRANNRLVKQRATQGQYKKTNVNLGMVIIVSLYCKEVSNWR